MIPALASGGLVLVSALTVARALAARHRRHADLAIRGDQGVEAAVPGWFATRFTGTDVAGDLPRLWGLWLTGFPVSGLAGFWVGGPMCAVLSAGVWSMAPWVVSGHLARRARARREEAVPRVLDSIARSLRSGASLFQALGEAALETGPLQSELRRVVAEAERGAGVAGALDAWADRQTSGSIRLAAAALCLGAETGGGNARAVDGVASTVRQRLAVAGEAHALTAQPRVSAQVIGLAPIAFAAFSAATDPALARMLFTTPLGWAMLGAGVVLDVVGMSWMMRMAR